MGFRWGEAWRRGHEARDFISCAQKCCGSYDPSIVEEKNKVSCISIVEEKSEVSCITWEGDIERPREETA